MNFQNSQNFITSKLLVDKIINLDDVKIYKGDTVLEIGTGKGIITQLLLKKVGLEGQVISLEVDSELYKNLSKKFEPYHNIKILNKNFLDYTMPKGEYKIYSNIPFNISSEILNKILDYKTGPSHSYLILQKETAERFGGRRVGVANETYKSILYYPFYDFKIIHKFKNTDFYPVPNVETVLLAIVKREEVLIPYSSFDKFQNFSLTISKDRYGEGIWKKLFTSNQLKIMQKNFGFKKNKGIHAQDVDAIVESFQIFLQYADINKLSLIKSHKEKYQKEQSTIRKIKRTRKYYKWKEVGKQ